MQLENITYRGLANCYRLSNDTIDLIITAGFGPRLLRFGFVGQENEFFETEPLEAPRDDVWRLYGGHRLWHAPETPGRTDVPDNQPVTVEDHGDFVRVIQPVEARTGIQKEMDISLESNQASVKVVHRMRNRGVWTVELSIWALSVMRGGGTAIIPLPPRGTHPEALLPTGRIVLWAYTDMADARWRWGRKYIQLRQDSSADQPQKFGAAVVDGWAAYARSGHLFVKTFAYDKRAVYPDQGSSVEVFTNSDMLELETLSSLITLPPDGVGEHVERWFLFRDVPDASSDDDIDAHILPLIVPVTARR